MAGELDLRVVLARPRVAALSTEQLIYALVELRPRGGGTTTLPLNLTLVLDRSGSMRGSKLERLREATWAVLDLLGPADTLALVAFSNRTRVLLPAGLLHPEARQAAQEAIRRLEADGGTNMAPAMEAGLSEVRRAAGPGVVSRMVLLTDGITEKEKRCLTQAEDARAAAIPIVALGIGRDWNDRLLETIAERTGGSADYVRQAEDIPQHFGRTVRQMQSVALVGAQLDLHTPRGVTCRNVYRAHPLIARLTGPPSGAESRQTLVPLGEIEVGHGQTLLLELIVPPRPPGTYRVAQVNISYDAPGAGVRGVGVGQDVLLEYIADPQAVPPPDPTIMNLVEKVTAFKLQTSALADLEAGNVAGATAKLQNAVTRLLAGGDLELAETVQQELTNLEKGRVMSQEGRKTIRFGSGQTVRLDRGGTPQ